MFVVLGIVAQKLKNIGKVRAFAGGGGVYEVCVLCFSEDPPGYFSLRGVRSSPYL